MPDKDPKVSSGKEATAAETKLSRPCAWHILCQFRHNQASRSEAEETPLDKVPLVPEARREEESRGAPRRAS